MKRLSVVIPALNEEGAVGRTVASIPVKELRELGLETEIIVVDNSSADNTAAEAEKAGAKVLFEEKRGYGTAYLRGLGEAKGDVMVVGDADGTYPMEAIPDFIEPILGGSADFVIGSRLKGRMEKGAMPWLHRHIGNPLLTFFLNRLFHAGISDAHCGMRAFSRGALDRMDLKTPGMEFASEMVIEAARKGLRIAELPIEYRARKSGEAKVNSFEDGWRHLRFMFLYSPAPIFLVAGSLLTIFGLGLILVLMRGPAQVGNFGLDIHPMILGNLFVILGIQAVILAVYSRVYAALRGIHDPGSFAGRFMSYNTLEHGILTGIFLFAAGAAIDLHILMKWVTSGFGELSELRGAILGSTLAAIGIQLVFGAIFISMLLLERGE